MDFKNIRYISTFFSNEPKHSYSDFLCFLVQILGVRWNKVSFFVETRNRADIFLSAFSVFHAHARARPENSKWNVICLPRYEL